jgi:hypothetical protein
MSFSAEQEARIRAIVREELAGLVGQLLPNVDRLAALQIELLAGRYRKDQADNWNRRELPDLITPCEPIPPSDQQGS